MKLNFIELEETTSTNAYLQEKQASHNIKGWVVMAKRQTAGKGMGSNTWESADGQNLTFSMALDMSFMAASKQFALSKAVPVGIIRALEAIVPEKRFDIKWPNDIYCEGHKVGGILINSTINGAFMGISIIGIGLNVHQETFQDWPTRPTSLRKLTGKEYSLEKLLHQVAENVKEECDKLNTESYSQETDKAYFDHLLRYRTWGLYEVKGERKRLFIKGVDPFGRLQLYDKKGKTLTFDIKEIKFVF